LSFHLEASPYYAIYFEVFDNGSYDFGHKPRDNEKEKNNWQDHIQTMGFDYNVIVLIGLHHQHIIRFTESWCHLFKIFLEFINLNSRTSSFQAREDDVPIRRRNPSPFTSDGRGLHKCRDISMFEHFWYFSSGFQHSYDTPLESSMS
jgi:hypothetical protein